MDNAWTYLSIQEVTIWMFPVIRSNEQRRRKGRSFPHGPSTPAEGNSVRVEGDGNRFFPYRAGDHLVGFDCIRRERMKKWWPMMASVTASPRCLGARKKVFPRKRQYATRYLAIIPCRTNERTSAT